ncbi:beta-lactamase [Streptomyces eurocidicus]|uniref:Beta-lactamase n=1 Tax=Streptomyces eurocidicus TaxID=66423 RepID=A0A2N8NTS0_STREU|nr:MBL fold metallo-hydrolase [Streptomyces eurocidicus]MBB5119374.1 glyoxylase-like metal-dependent hydrolase (beta-lactamase superfamily II) [Streptomyces eurocidicus]MBF6053047.1 MBL fold metallo-hydrolase [Streptomyces eurocidicus]PNE32171.1 beta-lactamase [Streptomyces eurocidicus]
MCTPQPTGPAPAGPARWTVGDITVHRVDEIPLPPATGPWLLPAATADVVGGHDWLRPDFADPEGVLRIDSHSFALVVDGLRVLVDTGVGNGKTRANPAWHGLRTDYLARLADAGFTPGNVDLVVLTHLHADHVGWNTREVDGVWVPTFPNARYLTARAEYDFWAAYDMDEARRGMFLDSVVPVVEAGLLDLVDVPEEGVDVAAGLRLVPAPGHTPGQVAVQLRSAGAVALITGDSVHHPVQLARPGIGSCVDIDPARAEATRRALLARLAGTGGLVLGTHFPAPTAGRVVAEGDGYRLEPVPGVSE